MPVVRCREGIAFESCNPRVHDAPAGLEGGSMKDRRIVARSPMWRWSGPISIFIVTITATCVPNNAGVVSPVGDTWMQADTNAVPLGAAPTIARNIPSSFAESRDTSETRADPDTLTLPDPRTERIERMKQDADSLPAIVIPSLTGDPTPADLSVNKGAANAIPLPPAVQSGLTGLAALATAAMIRRLRGRGLHSRRRVPGRKARGLGRDVQATCDPRIRGSDGHIPPRSQVPVSGSGGRLQGRRPVDAGQRREISCRSQPHGRVGRFGRRAPHAVPPRHQRRSRL